MCRRIQILHMYRLSLYDVVTVIVITVLYVFRYEAGLQKLLAAEGEVNVMKEELIQLQPKLIATGKQVEETLVVVNSQTEAAVAQKAVVSAEEAAASEKAAAAKAIKVCVLQTGHHTLMLLRRWLFVTAHHRFAERP